VPVAASDLDGIALSAKLAQPVEDPPSAHAGNHDQVADWNAFVWRGEQCAPQNRVRVLLPASGKRIAGCVGLERMGVFLAEVIIRRVVVVRLGSGLEGGRVQRVPGHGVESRAVACVLGDRVCNGVVGHEVRAGALGGVVLGCGDEDFPGVLRRWAFQPATSVTAAARPSRASESV
jgi:hypothetical protein